MTAPAPRFGLYAERYARYRITYPRALYDLILGRLDGPRDVAADLGAGTGQVTNDLLTHFRRVFAVDPDPEMIALLPDWKRVSVQACRAEDAVFPDEGLDLVAAGTAFHWMDEHVLCRRAVDWLRPGGVFAAFAYDHFHFPQAPAVQALVDAESAIWAAHKDPRLAAFAPYADRMASTNAFTRIDPISLGHEQTLAPAELAGFCMTFSFATAHARTTGDEAAYQADFAARLAATAEGAPVVMRYAIAGATGEV